MDLGWSVLTRSILAVTVGNATTFYKIVVTRGEADADATLSALSSGYYCILPSRWCARILQAHLYRYSKATAPNSVGHGDCFTQMR